MSRTEELAKAIWTADGDPWELTTGQERRQARSWAEVAERFVVEAEAQARTEGYDAAIHQVRFGMPKCNACGESLPTRSWGSYCACGEPTHPLLSKCICETHEPPDSRCPVHGMGGRVVPDDPCPVCGVIDWVEGDWCSHREAEHKIRAELRLDERARALAETSTQIKALVNPDALDCGDSYNLNLTEVLALLARPSGAEE